MKAFRFRPSIAGIMIFIAAIGVTLAAARFNLLLGCLLAAAFLVVAGRKFLISLLEALQRRKVGRPGVIVLTLLIAGAPYVLFFDPIDSWPGRRHVAREPMALYLLYSDDVPYISASRNWERTVSNLFEPHNTHIVPAWRILTWALVLAAGNLERIPQVFAVASYSILVAVMLLAGRVAVRESGRTAVGLAAMALVGTTSVMLTPASWYSAGQPLWAGFGILAALWYAQSYRGSGNRWALALGGVATVIAGWLWTIGHVAGPAAAVYLWCAGSRRCRRAAIVPLAATAFAIGLALGLGGAISIARSASTAGTCAPRRTPFKGSFIPLRPFRKTWFSPTWACRSRPHPTRACCSRCFCSLPGAAVPGSGAAAGDGERLFSPLECAGCAIVLMAYLVEWTFRGYMEFRYLRTINLRFTVPWYDAVPQIGAVLLLAGLWIRHRPGVRKSLHSPSWSSPTQLECLGVCLLVVVLVGLNRPRVAALVRANVPSLALSERKAFPIARLQTMRANVLLMYRALWQSRNLGQLAECERLASRMGWGRDTIRAAFGHRFLPGGANRRVRRITITMMPPRCWIFLTTAGRQTLRTCEKPSGSSTRWNQSRGLAGSCRRSPGRRLTTGVLPNDLNSQTAPQNGDPPASMGARRWWRDSRNG